MMSDGKVALVTGAAHGLGRAIASTLVAAGYAVAVTDVAGDAAVEAAAALASEGGRARGWRLDVRAAEDVATVFAEAEAAFGAPSVLVNNAGIFAPAALIDVEEAVWDRILSTNLTGAVLCAQAFARRRIALGGGGAIINIASTAAFSARPGSGAYSASKAGLVMLTKSLAMELGPHRIRVNALAPGLIDIPGKTVDPRHKQAFLPMVPYGRLGEPADVGRAVAFLASDDADFITGTVLPVDGGFLTGRALRPTDAG